MEQPQIMRIDCISLKLFTRRPYKGQNLKTQEIYATMDVGTRQAVDWFLWPLQTGVSSSGRVAQLSLPYTGRSSTLFVRHPQTTS